MNKRCPICSLRPGECFKYEKDKIYCHIFPIVKRTTDEGQIQIDFMAHGEIVYSYKPKFCPECGKDTFLGYFKCIDCGFVDKRLSAKQKRCPSCQYFHKKQLQNERSRKKYENLKNNKRQKV